MNFMDEALMEAQKAFDMGEVPVGAVIVKDNKIIGRGFNKKEILNSVVAHAEIMAIEDASRNLNNWRLNDC
ncbi:MAG: nucleoside deaminase, partial [Inconstantimicrobium porci]